MHVLRLFRDSLRSGLLAITIWPTREKRRVTFATLLTTLVTLVMLPWRESLGILNIVLVFLLLVFVLALRAGSRAATISALFSFMFVDLLFLEPYYTLTIARADHALALVVYVAVAITTGQLVSRLQGRTEEAIRSERRAVMLSELNAALIGGVTLDAILQAIVDRVEQVITGASAQILTPTNEGQFVSRAFAPAPFPLDRQDLAIAAWVLEQRKPSGRKALADTPLGRWRKPGDTRSRPLLMLPIIATERSIGVLAVERPEGAQAISPDGERVLVTFAAQAALAIDRARLTEEAARSAALAQSDELKSALLAAVSHDLRTPLATIKASTTSLLDDSVIWDEGSKREFLIGIDEETDRLTLMVSNLLDLSRIEGGALKPDRDWVDGNEMMTDVVRRLRTRSLASERNLVLELPEELPLLWLDYVEIAEVLMNLGDNSLKYSPPGATIRFRLELTPTESRFSVADNGYGMSERDRKRVFERFVRGESAERTMGAGIGLSICKGLVEAHGGRIWLESAQGVGTTVKFSIPKQEPTHEQ